MPKKYEIQLRCGVALRDTLISMNIGSARFWGQFVLRGNHTNAKRSTPNESSVFFPPDDVYDEKSYNCEARFLRWTYHLRTQAEPFGIFVQRARFRRRRHWKAAGPQASWTAVAPLLSRVLLAAPPYLPPPSPPRTRPARTTRAGRPLRPLAPRHHYP
jgi:hypothetical protein